MASLREKVEAELEQTDQALGDVPTPAQLGRLSALEVAGTASLLSSFYHGVENILKQALIAIGVSLPTGAAWHRDLLQLACARAIISAGTRDRLAPYMAFRHFFTHAYGFELDPERLRPLVEDLRAVYSGFKAEVMRFAQMQSGV